MYTVRNFKTKKELKEAVQKYNSYMKGGQFDGAAGAAVRYFQPGPFGLGDNLPMNGKITLEGPHYPEPHKWYAQAEVKNGVIVKVK
jgi:hypothetical protein